MASPTGNPVVDAIMAATSSDGRLQEAMLLGSNLESSWDATAAGDNNSSFGPFQIHLPAHPGVSKSQAEDPAFAVKYMLPAYQAAVNAQPADLWNSNPELAAEKSAFAAERPKVDYFASRGSKLVDGKWQETLLAVSKGILTGVQQSDPISGSNGILGTIGDSLSQLTSVAQDISNAVDTIMTFITTKLFLPSTWARVLAFSGGVSLIFIGLYLFFASPGAASHAAGSVVGAIPK